MSYDLTVYTANGQRASRAAVVANLRSMGWDVAFLSDYFKMTPAANDVLDGNYEIAVGWPADPALSQRVQLIVAACDVSGLDSLHESMEVGSCELHVGSLDKDPDRHIPDDLRPDQRQLMQSAQTYYYLRTSAGRSPLSFKFQEAFWRAIGQTTGGLLVDPQDGFCGFSHEVAARDVRSQLYSDSEVKPPMAVIEWYGALAIIGCITLFFDYPAPLPNKWYAMLLILHAPLAYGLFRGIRPVWLTCIGLSAMMVALGALSVFITGFHPVKLLSAVINAYLLWLLLSSSTREYFE